jgi:hypothetical protein
MSYWRAKKRVVDIGNSIGAFVDFLGVNKLIYSFYNIYCVGNGMGAHIGNYYKSFKYILRPCLNTN